MGEGFQSLQGKLLIAAPPLADPNFFRTVVLITEHSEDAAMGIVLNRPMELLVADAVPLLAPLVADGDAVFQGGPVQPEAVVALGEFADPADAAAIAFGRVGFLRADEDGPPADPSRLRVFSGYAGWGPGQLEDELGHDAWVVTPAKEEDVFAAAPERLWADTLRRMGGRYRLLASMPDDPAVN